MERHIKRADDLLQNIAAGLNQLNGRKCTIYSVEVTFHVGDEEFKFGLAQALDALASDLYWDDRGNWADAERATVREL